MSGADRRRWRRRCWRRIAAIASQNDNAANDRGSREHADDDRFTACLARIRRNGCRIRNACDLCDRWRSRESSGSSKQRDFLGFQQLESPVTRLIALLSIFTALCKLKSRGKGTLKRADHSKDLVATLRHAMQNMRIGLSLGAGLLLQSLRSRKIL